jgi:hypothetical protein
VPREFPSPNFWSLPTNHLSTSPAEVNASQEMITPAFVPIHWDFERDRNFESAELAGSLYRNSGARAAAFCLAERAAESVRSTSNASGGSPENSNSREDAGNAILATKLLLDAGLAVSAWNQIQKATRLLASSEAQNNPKQKTGGDLWTQIIHWQTMAMAAAAVHDQETASEWLNRSAFLLRRRNKTVSAACHSETQPADVTTPADADCSRSLPEERILTLLTGDWLFIQATIHSVPHRATEAISALRSALELHLKGCCLESAAADLHFMAQLELSMGDEQSASDSTSFGLELLNSDGNSISLPRRTSLQNALTTLSERCRRASASSQARSDVIRGN